MTTEETVLSAVLRGDETRWPFAGDEAARGFLDAAARHGIQPLVARQVRRGLLLNAPASVQQLLGRVAVQHAAVEQRVAAEVQRVVGALARAGVPALLMKGTALAYSHYPASPGVRRARSRRPRFGGGLRVAPSAGRETLRRAQTMSRPPADPPARYSPTR